MKLIKNAIKVLEISIFKVLLHQHIVIYLKIYQKKKNCKSVYFRCKFKIRISITVSEINSDHFYQNTLFLP